MKMHYDIEWVKKQASEIFDHLRPNESPDRVGELIPQKIWNSMDSMIQKDIQEMLNVYYHTQWTATCLMAYRILESAREIHIRVDLKENEVLNLGQAIETLKEREYPEPLIEKLQVCRQARNEFMHGVKRASSEDARDILGYVMMVVLQVYNYWS